MLHRLVPLFAVCAITAITAGSIRAQRGEDDGPPEEYVLEHVTYEERAFESKALGKEVPFGLFLPVGFNAESDVEYPLVLWLHGMFEDHDRFQVRSGARVLDQAIGAGEVPPLIFVCAEGDRSSFWTNGVAKGTAYEDMVAIDLLAHLDATLPILDDRNKRAIAGVSMGGYGALKIALKNPSLFGVVAAHSAALLPEDPKVLEEQYPWLRGRSARLVQQLFGDPIDNDKWRAENVLSMARTLEPDAIDGLQIYFDCGTDDRYEFDGPNAQLDEILTERKIPHTWRLVEGGGHGWQSGYNAEQLPQSLRFIATRMVQKAALRELGDLLGGDRKKDGEQGSAPNKKD